MIKKLLISFSLAILPILASAQDWDVTIDGIFYYLDDYSAYGGDTYATVHKLGDGKLEGVPEEMIQELRNNYLGECGEVGMYLAMARQADREGFPEVAEAFKRYGLEEAVHAAQFAELLGEVVFDTKTNLEKRAAAEEGACHDKFELAKQAKALGFDAIHDMVHEAAKDEARHGAGFAGLLKRYFGK